MTDREPIVPRCDLPFSVATEEMTGFEVLGIEKRFGKTLDNLGAVAIMMGTVWAFESRTAGKPASWSVVEAMTIRELAGYFQPEPDDAMPDEPDSDMGKES